MENKESKGIDREGLIAAIRAAVEAEGGRRISVERFTAVSKVPRYHVMKHFANWTDALKAAGFDFGRYNERLTDAQLLADWGGVARTLGRMPVSNEYGVLGKHGKGTLEKRFGSWWKVPVAFRNFAKFMPEWADVLAMIPSRHVLRRRARLPGGGLRAGRPPKTPRNCRMGDRPACGPLINAPGLLHAPTNEMGVILLFGAMAQSLGFMVESVQPRFPDCEAKRLTRGDEWQSVRIEFEYESRNFRDHGHDAGQCDLIVCWAHNWPECPKNIEVIALGEHVARRAGEGLTAEARRRGESGNGAGCGGAC